MRERKEIPYSLHEFGREHHVVLLGEIASIDAHTAVIPTFREPYLVFFTLYLVSCILPRDQNNAAKDYHFSLRFP